MRFVNLHIDPFDIAYRYIHLSDPRTFPLGKVPGFFVGNFS